MFPLRDINPTHNTPYVVFGFVAINTLVWLLQFGLSLALGPEVFAGFNMTWGAIPRRLLIFSSDGLFNPQALATPLSYMFLHGGWLHFITNMWFFGVFGDNVEDRLGHRRFLVFFLLCGVLALATHMVVDPASKLPLVGASGAIAGVLGAYVVLHPLARVVTFIPLFFVVEVPAFLFIFVWFGIQVLSSTLGGGHGGGVAFAAHVGGFLAGVILLPLFLPRGRDKGASDSTPLA